MLTFDYLMDYFLNESIFLNEIINNEKNLIHYN